MTDVLAIIPARGGSKGIPHKNLALCGGQPLVDWTVLAAHDARLVTRGVLSTDSPEISGHAAGKVLPLERPAWLAADDTSTEAVIEHALSVEDAPDVIVLLQPTSPLRNSAHVDDAIRLLWSSGADSVVSVSPSHTYLWDAEGKPLYAERKRRQEMEQYEENGAIYVTTIDQWRRTGNRLGGRVALYVMGDEHRIQIDSPADLEVVSRLMEGVPA